MGLSGPGLPTTGQPGTGSVQQLEQIVDFVAEHAGRVGGTEGTFHCTPIQHLVQDDPHQLPVVDDVWRATVQRTVVDVATGVVAVVVFINTTCLLITGSSRSML